MLQFVLRAQAVYYILSGAWPLVSMRSFEQVTGPKIDDWLVRMVALLLISIGVTLWAGARRVRPTGEIVSLSAMSAASFTAIDLTYALSGRIGAIYLADAAAEVLLLVLLATGWTKRDSATGRRELTAHVGKTTTVE